MVTTVSGTDNLFLNLLKYLRFSQFFSLSRDQQTAPLPPSSTFLCLVCESLSSTIFSMSWWVNKARPESPVFGSSPTTSSTKRANLTWLPLEIMHRSHTWHDYSWPLVSLTWLFYNLQLDDVPGADFENSLYAFGQQVKRLWVECIIYISAAAEGRGWQHLPIETRGHHKNRIFHIW